MNQENRRRYLIEELLEERGKNSADMMPDEKEQQRGLLRALMNVRQPRPVSSRFLNIQDQYLRERAEEKGITDYRDLTPVEKDIYLWRGDITTLKCDCIVNAANSGMLGCFCQPRVHRQCDTHLCRRADESRMCPADGGTGA